MLSPASESLSYDHTKTTADGVRTACSLRLSPLNGLDFTGKPANTLILASKDNR